MKDSGNVRKPEQDQERGQERDRGRERPGQEKGGLHSPAKVKVDKASFMAALAQGVVPRFQGQELSDSLSQMGNYAFLQAWQRRERKEQGLLKHAGKERFPAESLKTILKDVTEEFHPQEGVNTIDVMLPLPRLWSSFVPEDWLTNDKGSVSALAPASFEQASFSGQGIQGDLGGSVGGSDGTGEL